MGGASGLGVIAVVIVAALLGFDVTPFLQQGTGGFDTADATVEITPEDEKMGEFVAVTLADTEVIWSEIFDQQLGELYNPVTLVLYKQATHSACGGASGATGPFYCPGDKKAYLDTDFFRTLSDRLGAKGDFAAAYVIAHEVAHYVQDELGILGQANRVRGQSSEADANAISVRIELQADCYSGVWARYADEKLGTLDHGDIHEALNAARQIGDDTLQRNAGQRPMPHTFTHGTSAQRERWFARGYESGDMRACDTFSASRI